MFHGLVQPTVGGVRLLEIANGKVGDVRTLALPREESAELREERWSGARPKIDDEWSLAVCKLSKHQLLAAFQ